MRICLGLGVQMQTHIIQHILMVVTLTMQFKLHIDIDVQVVQTH